MARSESETVRRARAILAGTGATSEELQILAKRLQAERAFGLARRLLERGYQDPAVRGDRPLREAFARRLALSTYKDPDLPVDKALDTALAVLRENFDLAATVDQEVLGLTGAIWKRRFEVSAQKRDLERSAAYYLRGSEQGTAGDEGYTGINAAVVLDLLAEFEDSDTRAAGQETAAVVSDRRRRAREIREDILGKLPIPPAPPSNRTDNITSYWRLVTLAEALFGLGQFREARPLLERAGKIGVDDWQNETTARQLARLAQMATRWAGRVDIAVANEAKAALADFLGGQAAAAAVEAALIGKIGLALSGGGFRAALFHIGVLSRLAECDLLRRLEYLSCVSGGSIIGTQFYLEVRKLLIEKPDQAICRDDYIAIVRKIEKDFLAGVQRNIRTRVAAEWLTNLKMIFVPNYSRTLRVGELYESELFARVCDGTSGRERWLEDLHFDPHGVAPGTFNPKTDNWRRAAKVPILVINATALNTGHNWQFTGAWMGEPPANEDSEIDANYRLRRMYHEQEPNEFTKVRLGHAVAASSCVPGLFEPLSLDGLYPGKVVRLVDGGVHDNQGTSALLEQGCSILIVSDASGQMDAQDDPGTGLLGVPLRANSVLQARVREAQYRELDARHRSGLLRGLVFLHLKKGLEPDPVDWVRCQDPTPAVRREPLTEYGVQKHVQRRLAAIRTDLDSFSDTEAYALMLSGYRMLDRELQSGALDFALGALQRNGSESSGWHFLAADAALRDPNPQSRTMRLLQVADRIAFKVWRRSRGLQIGAAGIATLVLALLILGWPAWSGVPLWREWTLSLGQIAIAMVALVVVLAGLPVLRLLNIRKTFQQVAIGFGMATVGFIAARLHLHVFDQLFLWLGRLDPRHQMATAPPNPAPSAGVTASAD
jgi:predicted acylesterase/phospholipase RssA